MTQQQRPVPKRWPRYASLLSFFLLAGCVSWGAKCAEAASEWENRIAALDPFKQDDLVALNTSLTSNGILGYCKIREKILPLSCEALQTLISRTDKTPSLKPLHDLLRRAVPRPEDAFLLQEDIFINNKPLLSESPFHRATLAGAPITDTKPYAEQTYVNNLKLEYQKNNFIAGKKGLWQGPRMLEQKKNIAVGTSEDQQDVYPPTAEQGAKVASSGWSWQLTDDRRHDPLNAQAFLRQFLKHYEECAVQPVTYKNTVIVRSAYRLFCLSMANGSELWSFGPDNGGQEFYHTFRHPHQNSYGYDLFFSDGIVFSELGGRLSAVDVTDIRRPSLKWARELGEYTLCTKPVIVKDKLISGLVNARGEVWFCGFDAQTGTLAWSRYIGSSSFLAPPCTLMAVTNEEVIVGTNHGILARLAPDNGEIVWIKKYAPRQYSTLDYWGKGYYKDKFLDTGSLPYDTQFLKSADNGSIYYKPRESNYLYTIDIKNGETVQELYVDPSILHVLGAYDGKVALLQKGDPARGGTRVIVADMRSGTELSTVALQGRELKGVLHPKETQITFKVNETLYSLDIADTRRPMTKIFLRESGWLLGMSEHGVFIGENKSLKYLKLNGGTDSKNVPARDPMAQHLNERERVKKEFQKIGGERKMDGQTDRFLADIQQAGLSAEDVFSIVQNNLGSLKEPAWKGFVDGLNSVYGGQVVTYRDVQITLSNFLSGAGLTPHASYQKPVVSKAAVNLLPATKGYQFEIGETSLRPVNVIRGENPVNFFILLNNGQMVCVGEKGDIWWERKIFFGPVWSSGNEDSKDRRLYSEDIEIYLYDNVLITNDRVNVIAVDVHTGAYIWSMTNKRETLNDGSQLPPFKKDWSYDARLYFSKHIMLRTQFLEDVLVVSHGGMLYALDPKTGYCKAFRPSGLLCAMDMQAAGGRLYMASLILKAHIKVFDKDLKELGDFSASSLGENKEFWPQIVVLPQYILLNVRPHIYVFDKKNGQLVHTEKIGDFKRYYIEPRKDGFIMIAPFLKISGYRINDGVPEKEWEHPLEPQDQRLVWDFPSFRSAYYYMITKDRILNFVRKQDDHYVLALDLSTGKALWQTKLDGIQGRFFNLSNSVQIRGALQFIMTCVHAEENYKSDLDLASKLNANSGVLAVDIDSTLFRVGLDDGKLIQSQKLPSNGIFEFPGEDMVQTRDYVLYNVYRKSIQCVAKENP